MYDLVYEYRDMSSNDLTYTETSRKTYRWLWLARFNRWMFPTGPRKVDGKWYYLRCEINQNGRSGNH